MLPVHRYLLSWLLITCALLSADVLVNLLVDPYALFGIVRIDGFNRIKSQASQRGETFKRNAAERMRPNGIILGNSRAEVGFDPASAAWPEAARPVFNLALDGTGIQTAHEELDTLLHHTTPRIIVVGLDFLDFLVDPSARDDSPHPPPNTWNKLRERVSALLTLDAFADSLATLRAQHDPYPHSLTDAGFNPMRDYLAIASNEGYYNMFRQKDQVNARAYVQGPKSIYLASGHPTAAFLALEMIVRLARERNIAVRFVVYPYHAHILALFHRVGLWPAFEAWKTELVKLLDGATGADVELWDFSGFSPYADEAVPPPGDTHSDMRWYWEAGHFKKSLGDLLLARLFGARSEDSKWGARLTANNVGQHLRRQRAARDEYEDTHPQDMSELTALIAAAQSRH